MVMLLLHTLQDKTKDIIADKILKKNKPKSLLLVNPIISVERPEKEDLETCKYIDHTCHNTLGDGISG